MQIVARGKCDYYDDKSNKVEISVDTDAGLDEIVERLEYAKKLLDEVEYIFGKEKFGIYQTAQKDCSKFENNGCEIADYWDMLISNGAIKFTMIDVTGHECATVFMNNDLYNFMVQVNAESIVGIACHQNESKKGNE